MRLQIKKLFITCRILMLRLHSDLREGNGKDHEQSRVNQSIFMLLLVVNRIAFDFPASRFFYNASKRTESLRVGCTIYNKNYQQK